MIFTTIFRKSIETLKIREILNIPIEQIQKSEEKYTNFRRNSKGKGYR